MSNISYKRSAMQEKEVKILRMVLLAPVLGASLFAAIVLYISLVHNQPLKEYNGLSLDSMETISAVFFFLTCIEYLLAAVLFTKALAGKPPFQATEAILRIKTAFLVRLAIMESAALFGIVLLLLCARSGILKENPLYFLTGFPYLVLLFFSLATIPTKKKMDSLLQKIQQT